MMNRGLVICFALVLELVCSSVSANSPNLVGELGTADKLVFTGQKTFSEQQLREAVGRCMDLMLAGHPKAPFGAYLETLQSHIEAGYQDAGFPDARIDVAFVEAMANVMITIDEGRRYRNGQIEVEGAAKLSPDQIRKLLTEQSPVSAQVANRWWVSSLDPLAEDPTFGNRADAQKKFDPVWQPGKPTQFSRVSQNRLKEFLRRRFQESGFYEAAFSVQVRPDDNEKANLVIAIRDEGNPSFLGEIHVSGNEINSRSEITQFLDLTKGTLLTPQVTRECQQKLRASGRFLAQEVKVVPPFDGEGPSDLKVIVTENKNARPLSEELSAIEQAGLQVGQWLEGLAQSKDDISCNFLWSQNAADAGSNSRPSSRGFLKVVFSPDSNEGMLQIQFSRPSQKFMFDATIFALSERIIFDAGDSHVQCELPFSSHRLTWVTKLIARRPDKNGKTSELRFGAGVKAMNKEPGPALDVTCDPAAVISFVHHSQSKLGIEGNELVYRTDDTEFHFDVSSGRFLNAAGTWGDHGAVKLDVEVAPDLLGQLRDANQQQAAGSERFQINETPLAAFLAFVVASGRSTTPDGNSLPSEIRLMELAKRWQQREHVPSRIEPIADDKISSEDRFVIPVCLDTMSLAGSLFGHVLASLDDWFPYHSWTWTVSREFAFLCLGKAPYRDAVVISMIHSDVNGPIANLVTGLLFGQFSSKLLTEFGRNGLKKLTSRDFQNDYQAFLRGKTPIANQLTSLGRLLQECNDEDIDSIANMIPVDNASERAALVRALSFFHQRRERPTEKTIVEALDELWEPIVKERIKTLLEQLSATARESEPRKREPLSRLAIPRPLSSFPESRKPTFELSEPINVIIP